MKRGAESDRSAAQAALGAKLKELVEAGTLTRDEAVELYKAAFPEHARGGELEERKGAARNIANAGKWRTK